MPNYRRVYVPGGTYFFTLVLRDRDSRLLNEHISLLGRALREARQKRPFETLAIVVLPDHLHAIWRLPEGDSDYLTRWRHIKTLFARQVPTVAPGSRRVVRSVWQRGYWDRLLRDERDLEAHVDYVHFNPVKHGLVDCAADWPHSSFHRYVRVGARDRDWGGAEAPEIPAAGE